MFQKTKMAFSAMPHMDMVPFRIDWVRRSMAAMGRGPYPSEVLGRMEYDNNSASKLFINECNTGN
jgi:hypothetical protein